MASPSSQALRRSKRIKRRARSPSKQIRSRGQCSEQYSTYRKRQLPRGESRSKNSPSPDKEHTHTSAAQSWQSVDDWIVQTTGQRNNEPPSRSLEDLDNNLDMPSRQGLHGVSRSRSDSPSVPPDYQMTGDSQNTGYDRPATVLGTGSSGSSPVWNANRQHLMSTSRIFTVPRPQSDISNSSQRLWSRILRARYRLPVALREQQIGDVLEVYALDNESSLTMNLTPLIVPLPRMLRLQGHNYENLDYITESVNAVWAHCTSLQGSQPKPDIALGLSESAFTPEERQKLQNIHTSLTPTTVCARLYFPFLVCEVKGTASLDEARRQAMHAASHAVNALFQLYDRTDAGMADLNNEILAFSICHDHSIVEISGHFATQIGGNKVDFHRCVLYTLNLFEVAGSGDEWTRPYKIALAICELFAGQHRDRIKAALKRLRALPAQAPTHAVSFPGARIEMCVSELHRENEELKQQLQHIAQQRRCTIM